MERVTAHREKSFQLAQFTLKSPHIVQPSHCDARAQDDAPHAQQRGGNAYIQNPSAITSCR